MKSTNYIRISILVLAIIISIFSLKAQDNTYTYNGSVELPSASTYEQIRSQNTYISPSLRALGDEPELGGIDEPDPTVPVSDGVYPLIAALLGYMIYRKSKVKTKNEQQYK